MGAFDQAARYATQAEPQAVFIRLLSRLGLPLRLREWVDTRSTPRPGDPDRTPDRVGALIDESAQDRPWLLVLAFQVGGRVHRRVAAMNGHQSVLRS
jgi:hypothetical protein